MRRRDLLAGAGSAAGVAAGLARPALAQGLRELKMVTDWPEGLPGLQASAVRLAETIGVASGGRIRIEVFPAGKFVKAFETFEAVGAGVAEMFHSAPAYFDKRAPGSNFFSNTVPFGFTADELFAWMNFGGGQELWDELYGRYEVKPLLALSTGAQMGGWFNKAIDTPEGFKGLRYRMPGLGGEVLRRLGATVVLLPGGEIVPALKSGALDASEWTGPWLDMILGLHTAVSLLLLSRLPRAGRRPDARRQQARVGEPLGQRPTADRDRVRGRIRALHGRVQRQQRNRPAHVARGGKGQDFGLRRVPAAGFS